MWADLAGVSCYALPLRRQRSSGSPHQARMAIGPSSKGLLRHLPMFYHPFGVSLPLRCLACGATFARLCRFQRAAHLNPSQQGRRPNFFILLLGAKNKIKISLFYFSCNFNPNFSNRFFNCCLLASCCKRSLISACSCFILVLKSICSSRLPQTALAIVEGPAQLLTRAGLTRANVAPYQPAGLYPILNSAQRI